METKKECYLAFPKNSTIPKFRQWLKRNFADYEYADSLDVILDPDYNSGRWSRIAFVDMLDEDDSPIYDVDDEGNYTRRKEISAIYYCCYDETVVMSFEYTDSHYYAYFKDRTE